MGLTCGMETAEFLHRALPRPLQPEPCSQTITAACMYIYIYTYTHTYIYIYFDIDCGLVLTRIVQYSRLYMVQDNIRPGSAAKSQLHALEVPWRSSDAQSGQALEGQKGCYQGTLFWGPYNKEFRVLY